MLKDIEVKIIAPAQLPPVLYWLLNHKYHTEQWDFCCDVRCKMADFVCE
jgi:hypothetical protein|nr:MAG TPA: hypothetical protein [Caudoviricetes sp.]